ncbi:MAG: c-type cytochrome domain-containing protein, partial [Planctomycetota bacterium]|nr:c-type cytochrome domain-containing protein [Planctomycetota bacterium]
MRDSILNLIRWSLVVACLVALSDTSRSQDPSTRDFFETKIRPVLIEHCYPCHSGQSDEISGSLRVDSRESLRRGGDSGPAVNAGDPSGSLLMSAIRYETYEMPPSGKLPAQVIDDFEAWIHA